MATPGRLTANFLDEFLGMGLLRTQDGIEPDRAEIGGEAFRAGSIQIPPDPDAEGRPFDERRRLTSAPHLPQQRLSILADVERAYLNVKA